MPADFFTGHVNSRWKGGLFCFYYVAYTAYLMLNLTGNDLRHALRDVMIFFVIPLTAIPLAVATVRNFRMQRLTHSAEPKRNEGGRTRW